MKDYNFDKAAALAQGSKEVFYQFKLGETYQLENFKWFNTPVIPNGPHGLELRALKVRNTNIQPKAGKSYNIKFQVVYLTFASITIDILELYEAG